VKVKTFAKGKQMVLEVWTPWDQLPIEDLCKRVVNARKYRIPFELPPLKLYLGPDPSLCRGCRKRRYDQIVGLCTPCRHSGVMGLYHLKVCVRCERVFLSNRYECCLLCRSDVGSGSRPHCSHLSYDPEDPLPQRNYPPRDDPSPGWENCVRAIEEWLQL
jgi:hypothetical protein